MELAEKTRSKFLNLHTAASRVGALDIGAVSEGEINAEIAKADVIYNLGADEIELPEDVFVIYQGSHGDRGAHNADIIFPSAAYTEENGIFVNTEGRSQISNRANFAPGEAKENWAILRALSAELGNSLPFDNLSQLRRVLIQLYPHLEHTDEVSFNEWMPLKTGKLLEKDFVNCVHDFYLTNPIARASSVMAELSANAKVRNNSKVAAE
jgi:NADH-quinone oxidoreductase subunit G